MQEIKTTIIIGAGVGGLSTALRLAQKGIQVTVFEKDAFHGGRCGQLERDGHRFDLGATIYLMPSIYRSTFASMGLNIEECVASKPLETIYRMHFDDGETFDFTTNREKLKEQVERLEPGSYNRLISYIETGYRLFKLSMKQLLGRNFYHVFQFINLKNIGLIFKIKTHIKHMAYIRRFVKHPHLQKTFTFQNIYVGQNPYTAPALFAMLPGAELSEGSLAPVGGMSAIPDVLLMECQKLGVKVICNAPVQRILVTDKNRVEGVELEDGSKKLADLVVANADLPYVYASLLRDKQKARHHRHMKYSCSAIVFHWALDKRYDRLAHHSVFLTEPYKENFRKIFSDKTLSSTPSFYVYSPVRLDASVAPEGHDSLTILVPSGHLDARKQQDWDALMQTSRDFVIQRLKQEGLEDIESHIKFELTGNPVTWNESFHVARGSVFGSISHSIFQMGYFRPHNRHARYKNLYFVGGSTHPGNGVPLVLLSAQLTSERILRDMNC